MSDAVADKILNKSTINPKFNPFPGLRPFGIEESHLFFGREGQSDEILNNLAENRFVAVMGASGSGKSSLIYCGLVPILHGGFITDAGSNWRVVASRPGGGPIDNLATAIVKSELDEKASVEEVSIQKNITSTILRSSSLGLIEAVKQLNKSKGENVLFIIDQFEELFRYKNSGDDDEGAINESSAFVKLLLTAIRQSEVPIYVVLTMRSDFIGDCAQFQELTKAINDSNYLIPQMTREDFKTAVEGPVAVGGGKISARLVQQLLNDVGDKQDQLPILQHALMRTWDHWIDHRSSNEILDISHYQAIGQMESALSEHANEAYDELSEEEKRVCESMFKTLTEKGGDNRGIRHPTQIKRIAEIAQADEKTVEKVVEIFRAQGRSFLTPSAENPLKVDSVIDISHESLMRIWDRLKIWVDEEGNAVSMYLRLSEAAELYQLGKTGLWRPPDLQLALSWREKQKPTLPWARRFNPAFERTMVYLETSRKEFQAEEENKVRLQKRALRRTRIFAMVLGSAAIISIGVMLYAFMLQIQATQAKNDALEQKALAEENEKEANRQKEIAEIQKEAAEKAKEDADRQRKIAIQQEQKAREQEQEAIKQGDIARLNAIRAERQSELAKKNEKIANEQSKIAQTETEKAVGLRYLSIAKAMAIKAPSIRNDNNLMANLSYKAYQFNDKYGGRAKDGDVYNGLYETLKHTNLKDYNRLQGHSGPVRDAVYNKDGSKLYTTGTDGKIIQWDMKGKNRKTTLIVENNGINRSITISPDDRWLACATDTIVQLIDLKNTRSPIIMSGHIAEVWDLHFSGDSKTLYSSSADKTIRAWKLESQTSTILTTLDTKIRSFDIDEIGNKIAAGSADGKIMIWDFDKNTPPIELTNEEDNELNAIAFSNDGSMLTTGDYAGIVVVWDMRASPPVRIITLTGQTSPINDIEFSKDDKLMASASSDHTVNIWETKSLTEQPFVLTDHEFWVWSIAFNPNGGEIITTCLDNVIRRYPTNAEEMANQMCDKIARNMSLYEWNRYVADDIDYEKTCEELPAGEGAEEKAKDN